MLRKSILISLAFQLYSPAQTYEQKIASAMERVERVAAQGPFRPEWKSLESYQVPDWYMDAKFGIFIHWGVYSVPAFGNEWYPRNMYLANNVTFKHHVET